MKINEKYINTLYDIAIGIVSGFITSFFFETWIALITGIIFFFLAEFIRLRFLISSVKYQYTIISNFFNILEKYDNYANLLITYSFRPAMCNIRDSEVVVQKDIVRQFWRDCIAQTKMEWDAISYTVAKDSWDLAWNDEVLDVIQKERIESKCKIHRIFILDENNKDEQNNIDNTMEKQVNMGIHVYSIQKEKLLKNELTKKNIEAIGSKDFAVVDRSWVFMINVNEKDRTIQSASITKNKNIVNMATDVLREARKLAIDMNDKKNKRV